MLMNTNYFILDLMNNHISLLKDIKKNTEDIVNYKTEINRFPSMSYRNCMNNTEFERYMNSVQYHINCDLFKDLKTFSLEYNSIETYTSSNKEIHTKNLIEEGTRITNLIDDIINRYTININEKIL